MKQLSLQLIFFPILSFLHVDHTLKLLHVNWFQCSSTKSLSGMVQLQYAWKMRNSPFSSHLLQNLFYKVLQTGPLHDWGENICFYHPSIWTLATSPASKMLSVQQSQSCFACHHFQIIYQLQLADSSCHHSALWTL